MKKLIALSVLVIAITAYASDSMNGARQPVRTLSNTDMVMQSADTGGVLYTGVKTGQLPAALGQSTKSGSVSVAIASDQGALTVTGLPAALGQTTMSASTPVTIASNQSALAVTGTFWQATQPVSGSVGITGTVSTTQGAASGAATVVGTQTNIGATTTTAIACSGTLASSTPSKLYRMRVTALAPARCIVRHNNNGVFTTFGNLMTTGSSPNAEITFPAGFAAITTGSAGAQQWEVNCANLDSAAQDFGVDCSYCVSASGC